MKREESLGDALDQLSTRFGIELPELVESVEGALAQAYRKAFDPPGEIVLHLDPRSGEMRISSWLIADDGSQVERMLPVDDFKRTAAQTARWAVMRHLRNLERDLALSELAQRHGELSSGTVDRVDRGQVYIDLGKVQGWMPPEEQIPGEVWRPGQLITVVLLEPRARWRDAQVRVSRNSKTFVLRLLEAEVPEVASGLVQVREIVREAGLRSKVAVSSEDRSIDPVGSCVGPRGVRHHALLTELGGEHLDIVPYSTDHSRFVAAALGPARILTVEVDLEIRNAQVTVERDQLSLAIGKDGQNARLAAKLTGLRIDIRPSEADPLDASEDGVGENPPAPAPAPSGEEPRPGPI